MPDGNIPGLVTKPHSMAVEGSSRKGPPTSDIGHSNLRMGMLLVTYQVSQSPEPGLCKP